MPELKKNTMENPFTRAKRQRGFKVGVTKIANAAEVKLNDDFTEIMGFVD